LDAAFVAITSPLAAATRQQAAQYSHEHGLPAVFLQPRVGANLQTYFIQKFTTLFQDGAGNDVVINELAARFRANRRDELGQRSNLWDGFGGRYTREMALIGRRPTIAAEYEQFYEELDPATRSAHMRIVEPTLPGIGSSFALAWASGQEVGSEEHAQQNIEDVMRGSLHYDIGLATRLGLAMIQGRLHDRRFGDVAEPALGAETASMQLTTLQPVEHVID
jgi:lipopolysaccharide/colanic/teichoic acid biosynthesis glycosyltransferase